MFLSRTGPVPPHFPQNFLSACMNWQDPVDSKKQFSEIRKDVFFFLLFFMKEFGKTFFFAFFSEKIREDVFFLLFF